MREIPKWFSEQLLDFGGRRADGKPKMRVVWSPDTRRPTGAFKYPNPEKPLEPMECWMVEVWHPPTYFGSPQEWTEALEALLGPFPYEGEYLIKHPLMTADGKPLELNQSTMDAIKQKHLADIQWSEQTTVKRLADMEEVYAGRERAAQERAEKEAEALFEHYHSHAHDILQEDERTFSFPKALDSTVKGNKASVKANQ